MNRRTLAFLLAAALTAVDPSFAQDQKVAVSVTHSGEDNVGQQFAFAVREAIRGSHGFKLTQSDELGMQVRLITVNPENSSTSSNWTVATVVLTMSNFFPYDPKNPQSWYPIYLTSHVMTVGTSRTDSQARSVLASLDAALDRFRRDSKR